MSSAKVLIMMADYGHDPTETAAPYTAFKKAGFDVSFATESGKVPECDKKMLQGITQLLLGATKTVVSKHTAMATSPEIKQPLAWTKSAFTLDGFDLVFLPGGHDKGARQLIDSPVVHRLLVDYFPKTRKDGPEKKVVAAVCHGVMVLSESKDAEGRSVIRECETTALPARFEQLAFWGTRAFLGDYYKTYGAGSDDVEVSVRKVLADPDKQYKNSLGMGPFVVEDSQYNYITARFPGDVELLCEKTIALVLSLHN